MFISVGLPIFEGRDMNGVTFSFTRSVIALAFLSFSIAGIAGLPEQRVSFNCIGDELPPKTLNIRSLSPVEAKLNFQKISSVLTFVAAREFSGPCARDLNGYFGATLFRQNLHPIFYPRNAAQSNLPQSKWQRRATSSDPKGNPYFQTNALYPSDIRGRFRGAAAVNSGSLYVGIWTESGVDKVYSYELKNGNTSRKHALLLQSKSQIVSVGALNYPGKRLYILQKRHNNLIGYDLDWNPHGP